MQVCLYTGAYLSSSFNACGWIALLLAETWELEERCVENCTCSGKFVTCETSMDVNADALISHIGSILSPLKENLRTLKLSETTLEEVPTILCSLTRLEGTGFNEQQDPDHTELLPHEHHWTAILHRRLEPHLHPSGRHLRRTSTVTDDLDPIQSYQLHRSNALLEYIRLEKFDQARH